MAQLDGVGELAQAIAQSVTWVVSASTSWWLGTPTGELGQAQIVQMRNLLVPLAIIIATAGVMWQGIRMILTRRSAPLIDVGRGLWSVVGWGAIGTIAPLVALKAGDEFSTWILSAATGATTAEVQARMVSAFSLSEIPAPGAVVILGIVVMIAVFIQTLLMLLRELAVLLIAVLLQTAAASTIARPSGGGIMRLLGWSAALIMYKPIVALIYSMAFLVIGQPTQQPSSRSFFVATAALLLSLIAFPASLRFFQRSVRALDGGWNARGHSTSTATMDAGTVRALSGSGGIAGAHARYLSQSMHTPTKFRNGQGDPHNGSWSPGSPYLPHSRLLPSWLTEAPGEKSETASSPGSTETESTPSSSSSPARPRSPDADERGSTP